MPASFFRDKAGQTTGLIWLLPTGRSVSWWTIALLVVVPCHAVVGQSTVIDSLAGLVAGRAVTGTVSDTLIVRWENKIGAAHLKAGRADSGLVHLGRSVALLEAMDADDRGDTWFGLRSVAWKFIGRAHMMRDDPAAALAAYQRFYLDAEKRGMLRDMGAALDYMGTVHLTMHDVPSAIARHREAIGRLSAAEGAAQDLALAYGNLAEAHAQAGAYDSAVYWLRRGLPVIERNSHPLNLVQAHLSMASAYIKLGRLDSADHYLALAAPIVERSGHAPITGQFKMVSAAVAAKRNELGSAERDLVEAVSIAEQLGHGGEIASATRQLAQVRTEQGSKDSTVRELSVRADSALVAHLGLEKVRQVATMDADFRRYREAIVAEERLRQELARVRLLWIGLGAALVVAAVLLYLVRRVRSGARSLREKNEELVRAQHQLVISERQREAEKVRTHIARDVHDQLGSDLTKLVMLSTEAKAMAREDINALPGIADDIERVAGEANRSLGDIVWAIDPHHDSLAGLTERVRAHCERMLKWSRVAYVVDCTHTGPDRSLDPATKRDIYLILREALNNAIKYAKAAHIEVAFHTSAASLAMELKDDGVGFTAEGQGIGHGLENMRARAERIGARFELEGMKGTVVRLTLVFPD